jgi:hypothetical protein
MSTNLANGADDSWLTPRDTFLLIALSGPSPADVHRDLADILRGAAAYAHTWQPIPAPAIPAAIPAPAIPATATAAPVSPTPATPAGQGALAPLARPTRSAGSGYWFRRGPLRPRASSAGL